jgi:hypothetical protein
MMTEATEAVGLAFDQAAVRVVRADPADRIHGDVRSVSGPAG